MKKQYYEIRARSRTYLCLKTFLSKTSSFIKRTNTLNRVIKGAHYSQIIPQLAAQAKITKNAAIAGQEILKVSYLKNIAGLTNCSSTAKIIFVKHFPYKFKSILYARDIEGKTILRKNKWKITNQIDSLYSSIIKNITPPKISINLQVKSNLSLDLLIDSKEIN